MIDVGETIARDTVFVTTLGCVPILLGIAVCYLIITIPLGQLAGWMERKAMVQR